MKKKDKDRSVHDRRPQRCPRRRALPGRSPARSSASEEPIMLLVVVRGAFGRPFLFRRRHDNDNLAGGPTHASGQ